MAIENVEEPTIKKVYKNLFFDNETSSYAFINGRNRREVVSQEAYLLIYLIEIMKGMKQ